MTSKTESFKLFKICLKNRINHLAMSKELFWYRINDAIIVIEMQKDAKYKSREEVKFTINLGISVDALRNNAADVNSLKSFVPPVVEKCHWRQRLGRLLPGQNDSWWSFKDEISAQAVCADISAALTDHALPIVENMASSEALVCSWKEGRGQGLTEYERRRNLAQLLVALGRRDEAQQAIQALEEASLGKSWAASAAHQLKGLRAALEPVN